MLPVTKQSAHLDSGRFVFDEGSEFWREMHFECQTWLTSAGDSAANAFSQTSRRRSSCAHTFYNILGTINEEK